MSLNLFNNFDFTTFISTLGLGGILGFVFKSYIIKRINRKFIRDDIGIQQITKQV